MNYIAASIFARPWCVESAGPNGEPLSRNTCTSIVFNLDGSTSGGGTWWLTKHPGKREAFSFGGLHPLVWADPDEIIRQWEDSKAVSDDCFEQYRSRAAELLESREEILLSRPGGRYDSYRFESMGGSDVLLASTRHVDLSGELEGLAKLGALKGRILEGQDDVEFRDLVDRGRRARIIFGDWDLIRRTRIERSAPPPSQWNNWWCGAQVVCMGGRKFLWSGRKEVAEITEGVLPTVDIEPWRSEDE